MAPWKNSNQCFLNSFSFSEPSHKFVKCVIWLVAAGHGESFMALTRNRVWCVPSSRVAHHCGPCSNLKQPSTPSPKCEYLGCLKRGVQAPSLWQEWREFQAEASTSQTTRFIVTLHTDHYSTSHGHRTVIISLISLLLKRLWMTIWSGMGQI